MPWGRGRHIKKSQVGEASQQCYICNSFTFMPVIFIVLPHEVSILFSQNIKVIRLFLVTSVKLDEVIQKTLTCTVEISKESLSIFFIAFKQMRNVHPIQFLAIFSGRSWNGDITFRICEKRERRKPKELFLFFSAHLTLHRKIVKNESTVTCWLHVYVKHHKMNFDFIHLFSLTLKTANVDNQSVN